MAADWILVPCLDELHGEFNTLGPGRDHASDGSIGNQAHAASESDHNPDETGATGTEDADSRNEVHAIDVDDSGPWINGFRFDDGVELIRQRCLDGREKRLQYIIRNGRIASRSWGWTWRTYTGSNGHYEHGHFSARYDTGALENDRRPWGLVERWGDMPLTETEMDKLVQKIWGFDPGDNKTGATNGGMPMPWAKAGDNATANPAWGLSRAVVGTDVAYQIRDRVDSLAIALTKVLANVTADDSELQALQAAIAEAHEATVRDVLTGLGGSTQSDAELAAALKASLGDRAAAVGQLLAAS